MNIRSNTDPYERLQQLYALRARSEAVRLQSQEDTRQIDDEIAAEEAALANMTANEKRAWMRRVNRRGASWVGTAGAAGALRDSPVVTAAIGGLAGAGVTATVFAFAIGLDPPNPSPPVAGQRPSISAPPAQPSVRPAQPPEARREPRHPPRVITVPVRIGPPGLAKRSGTPKVPVAPALPPAPPEETPPPVAAAETPEARTCLADVRLLAISTRLLCR